LSQLQRTVQTWITQQTLAGGQPPFSGVILQSHSRRPPAKIRHSAWHAGHDGPKTVAGRDSHKKAPGFLTAREVQLPPEGFADQDYSIYAQAVSA
jgi:hypothetical protein